MTQDREHLAIEDKEFKALTEEVGRLLAELRKNVTRGDGILDPNTQKKKEMLAKIKPLLKQLKTNWALLEKQQKQTALDKAKEKLMLAMLHLKALVSEISGLDTSREAACIQRIGEFNEETQQFKKAIDSLSEEYRILKANIKFIAMFEYGKDIANTMGYATIVLKAVVTIGLAWYVKFAKAVQTAGSIFSPIGMAFASVTKLFGFFGRAAQFFIAKSEYERAVNDEMRRLELDDTKALLRKSATLYFISFTLSVLATLALTGLFATPLGWAFVAAASLVDWTDEGLGASQRADKELEKFKQTHQNELDDPQIKTQLSELQAKADNARSEARWQFASVIGMALVACGPIPFAGPALGLLGLAIFSIVAVRNTYVAAKPYIENYIAGKKPNQKQDNELETEHEMSSKIEAEKVVKIDLSVTRVSTLLSSPTTSDVLEKHQAINSLNHRRKVSTAANPKTSSASIAGMFRQVDAKDAKNDTEFALDPQNALKDSAQPKAPSQRGRSG